MSRSAFLKTNELPNTTDLRFVHGLIPANRSNEPLPIAVQSLSTKTANESIVQKNLRLKRNLKDKRRATGIRPDEVSLASTSTEVNFYKKISRIVHVIMKEEEHIGKVCKLFFQIFL
jgi:hypothetical protein